jgi:hypothetical protein
MHISPQLLARVFGVCFLLSFLSYGIGIGLLEINGNEPASSHISSLIGGFLVVFCHTLFNLALLVAMFFLLKRSQEIVAFLYLILGGVSSLLLAMGGIFLLSFHGLASEYQQLDPLSLLLTQANFYSYQFGMAIWAMGGMLMCYLLLSTPLVPSFFSFWGFFAYFIFLIGCLLEVFGQPLGIYFSIPGGLFEIGISGWLIVKGVPKKLPIKPVAVSVS